MQKPQKRLDITVSKGIDGFLIIDVYTLGISQEYFQQLLGKVYTAYESIYEDARSLAKAYFLNLQEINIELLE